MCGQITTKLGTRILNKNPEKNPKIMVEGIVVTKKCKFIFNKCN